MKVKLLISIGIFIVSIAGGLLYILLVDFNTDEIIVAVMDTGVDYNHDLLQGKVLNGIDIVDFDLDPMDEFGHGTHVAGIITTKAPSAKILPIRTLNEYGTNGYFPNGLCIIFAIMKGADIINMSYSSKADISTAIATKIGHYKGVIFVGAAGDQTSDGIKFPASLDEVLSVGTVKPSLKEVYYRSNYGEDIDYLAPGVAMSSSDIQKEYFKRTGTSMSAAYVSGAIAYIKSKSPILSSKNIKPTLEQFAHTIHDTYTYSVLDFEHIQAIYENNAYFTLGEISLAYKNAELEIPYKAYDIYKVVILNNYRPVKTINLVEEHKITIPLHHGLNLLQIIAKTKNDFFLEEIRLYKDEHERKIIDKTLN